MDLFDDVDERLELYRALDRIRSQYGDRSVVTAAGMEARTIRRSIPSMAMRPCFLPTVISKFIASCGRYVTVSTVQTIESRFQVQAAPDVSAQWRPNANVSHGEATGHR